ncbi:Transient receptor potential channel pyrexia [Camponotus floridanus]|uniref:Transient receptor potential channel pyrexia n=1 Tax=Camponotus floridanus TaxID=104421 RepID=E2ARQ0_CAMFO|nr:Transient receptor potential channel pyrexia [Camponotus floridanus]
MNLMVGLAVWDIQEICRMADFKLLLLVHHAEIIEQCSQQCTIRIRPNDPREKCLPRELIQSLYRLAGEKKMRRGTFRGDASSPQNHVAKESKYVGFNRTYSNVGNQQQLDDLVVELKECSYDISIRIKEETILVDENRAAATMTPVQLLAEWPDTCLLISSWLGHVELVKALIEKGVPVSTKDNDGRTLLHLAACTASTKIVEELLKHDADSCEWDFEKKYTPLHCAAAAGCVDTVKCLIKSKADVDARRSPLYYAVLNNAVDCVETLLQAGACPDNSQVLLHHNHNLNINLVEK